ncbi:MAG: hypothetical protein GXP51_10000 [Deltaproteobacteria bacterium]|nr:hypothetical protein [Deltaproteobacteria bacterium]
MNCPTQIRKISGVLLCLLLFLFSGVPVVQAAPKVTLTGMEKQEKIGSTRLTFLFTGLPDFEVEHSGQRVDLLLKNVWFSAKLRHLPEDETVVKILLAQKHRDLLMSLLLRRPPQQVITESRNDPPRIIMDLFWEGDQNARPGVAFRIADMPVRKAGGKKARNYQKESPWAGHWRDFFRDYQTYWKLKLPLHYSLPPLPPLVTDPESPLWPLQQFADAGKWLSLLRQAGQLEGLQEQPLYRYKLLVAEAQLRSGATAAGLARLQALHDQQGPEPARVSYLIAYGQALSGQPFVALLTLQELLPNLSAEQPLMVFSTLLAAETALASNRYKLTLGYLQNDQRVWPEELLAVVKLRRADARAGLGQLPSALVDYHDLLAEPGLFDRYPSSCNRAAFSAYRSGDYKFASRLYRKLVNLAKEQPGRDLLQFAAGASAYAAGDLKWGLIGLQKASLDWPGTEGGERAELRLIDHQLLTGGESGMAKAASDYGRLGIQAGSRMVREEATFKRALALYLLADHRESVNELMHFRREFGSSKLRRETDLLLLEQLPKVVHRLLQQQQELDAVVLVEQNRKLLLRGGFDRSFLHDLAGAFDDLGLYARAGRVLLYMFDRAPSEAQRKPLYLPLAESFLQRNEFKEASGYADRYLQKYPRGADSAALFGVLLDAFEKQGRHDELLAWLARKDRPHSPELEIRAAWIYWQQQRLEDVAASLERARRDGGKLQVKEMALLAEVYYRLHRNTAAEKIYRQLEAESAFSSQARYRQAQILLRGRKRRDALNLLTQLVEEDGNSPWGRLAQDLLIQEKQ